MRIRVSRHIGRKQARNFKPAVRTAGQISYELNCFVTINFNHTMCSELNVSMAFAKLRSNFFGPWCRRPPRKSNVTGIAPTFVWALENTGHTAAHWLVHIPPERFHDFERRLPDWLTRVTGGIICEKSAISILRAYRPIGAAKYMMKGIDPVYANFYGITSIPQGVIYGKRCGFSQNLGPYACRMKKAYWTQMNREQQMAELRDNALNLAALSSFS